MVKCFIVKASELIKIRYNFDNALRVKAIYSWGRWANQNQVVFSKHTSRVLPDMSQPIIMRLWMRYRSTDICSIYMLWFRYLELFSLKGKLLYFRTCMEQNMLCFSVQLSLDCLIFFCFHNIWDKKGWFFSEGVHF